MRIFNRAQFDHVLALGDLVRRLPDAQALLWRLVRPSTDRDQAQRTALAAFAIRVLGAGLALLSQVLLARWLGQHDYGIFAFIWVFVILAGGLLPLGFATSAQRFLPQHDEENEPARLRGFLFGSRMFVILVGTVLALTGAAGLWLFADQVSGEYLLPLYLALVCLPLFALTEVQDGIARSYSWTDLALFLPYVLRPLVIIAGVGLTLLVVGEADAVTAGYALIAAVWATGLIQLLLLNNRLGRQHDGGPRAYSWRLWISTSLPIFLVDGFYMLLTNVDVLLLTWFREPAEVALYYAAAKILALISFVPFAVTAATTHKIAEYNAAGQRSRLNELITDAVRWTFWPAAVLTILVLAAGVPLLWLFGPEFTAGYPVMFVLALGFLVRASIGPAERILSMMGQQNICAGLYAAAFALNIGLNLLLIPLFGVYGAAWATTAALSTETVLLYLAVRWKLGFRLSILSGGSVLSSIRR